MRYTLTVDGIPVGFVELVGAPRAVGSLFTLPASEASGLRAAARRLGLALELVGWTRVGRRVVGRALASALAGAVAFEARLGLVDERGVSAAIRRIAVVEFPGRRGPVVVAALRDQAAGTVAECGRATVGPGRESRPAA